MNIKSRKWPAHLINYIFSFLDDILVPFFNESANSFQYRFNPHSVTSFQESKLTPYIRYRMAHPAFEKMYRLYYHERLLLQDVFLCYIVPDMQRSTNTRLKTFQIYSLQRGVVVLHYYCQLQYYDFFEHGFVYYAKRKYPILRSIQLNEVEEDIIMIHPKYAVFHPFVWNQIIDV